MRAFFDGFFFSISYFSILPFKKNINFNNQTYKYMLFFLPFVGALLAIITLLFFILLKNFFPPFYAAFLSSLLYLILYGFLHLEAVSDVIDGWFASYSNKDVYSIMKEAHIGAIGAIGTFIVILLKIVAISYLLYLQKYDLFLIGVVFSRLIVLKNLFVFEFHPKSFFILLLKKSINLKFLLLTFLLYIFTLSFFVNSFSSILISLALISIFSIFILNTLQKRFGFLNGDCIGFSIEMSEVLILTIGFVL